MRKLASIRRISEINPIEGADAICLAAIDGWNVVVKIGEYSPGDRVVYLEIDSFIPTEIAPYLTKNAAMPKEYNGVRGERLRTIKLRGALSQGLVLPMNTKIPGTNETLEDMNLEDGSDVSEILGIQKWEPAIPAQLAGKMRGNFPTELCPRTDQERVQNLLKDVLRNPEYTYEVSLKIDGSSMTVIRWEYNLRVCSRNLELLVSEENSSNSFIKAALEIQDKIPNGYAFQGELYGEGIQGNKEGIKGQRFAVFDVYDIKNQKYLNPMERRSLCAELGIEHVPVLNECQKSLSTVQEFLDMADGPSINAKLREGLVWKCNEDPSFSFKAISNKWLMKNE
jgi:RNA ligase (TIGR02306 family)